MSAPVAIGSWLFRFGEGSLTVSPDRETVYAFDGEGRPVSWFDRGRVFKRSLASEVFAREREGGERRRSRVPPREAGPLFESIRRRVEAAPVERLDADGRARIEEVLGWTPERLDAEKGRFDAVYRPISILPPDQYLAIVLQATFGCSWNRCTFCGFYQDRPFETRPAGEFLRHVEGVRALLGRASRMRRSLFLADGNALILANDRLRPIFAIALDAFPGRKLHGFVDVFAGERKPAEAWRELRAWGLARVAVGLETGHDPLLRWMNKPGSRREGIEFVRTLKSAGIAVSAILMCGVGGDRFADAHVEDTLAMAAELPLDAGDLVYLSPFIVLPASAYEGAARQAGVRDLTPEERRHQYVTLRDGIRAMKPSVRVALYDIQEFLY